MNILKGLSQRKFCQDASHVHPYYTPKTLACTYDLTMISLTYVGERGEKRQLLISPYFFVSFLLRCFGWLKDLQFCQGQSICLDRYAHRTTTNGEHKTFISKLQIDTRNVKLFYKLALALQKQTSLQCVSNFVISFMSTQTKLVSLR